MILRLLGALMFFGICQPLIANCADLFILRGEIESSQGAVYWTSFNCSEDHLPGSAHFSLSEDEPLVLTIHNLTEVPQTFTIDGIFEGDNLILPSGQLEVNITFPSSGTYRYYSNFEHAKFTGASGIVSVGEEEYSQFFWNLFDLEKELSFEFGAETANEYPLTYKPELFLINGRFYPATLEDESVMVLGMVGQTVYVNIVNSGYMDHVMHFHGFHAEIVYATLHSERVGWIKDSVPIKPGEAMRLKLFFNQPGMYPVHDHNLIAVTNTGFYPGGMITHIDVME